MLPGNVKGCIDMADKESRLLVIDASIANAAGEINPASKIYRDFLEGVRVICHRVVMTPEIADEWNRHQTRFAKKWRRSMVAKKKVYLLGSVARSDLREKISRAATHELACQAGIISPESLFQLDPASIHEYSCEAMLKDTHLLEAAMETDRTVISLDDTVRRLFAAATKKIGEIRNVIWVNPNDSNPGIMKWLESGAKSEKNRWLVSQAPE